MGTAASSILADTAIKRGPAGPPTRANVNHVEGRNGNGGAKIVLGIVSCAVDVVELSIACYCFIVWKCGMADTFPQVHCGRWG